MINKYAKGGKSNAGQEQLVKLFQAAAENAQVDPQELVQKASEIGQDEQAAAQFMQGLQLCAQGDPEGIKFIKSLFQSPAFRQGGKIWNFVCKHAKGGYVAGCGCVQKGEYGIPKVKQPHDRKTYFNDNETVITGKMNDPNMQPAGSPTEMDYLPMYDPYTGRFVGYRYYGRPQENWDIPTNYKKMQKIYNDKGENIGTRFSENAFDKQFNSKWNQNNKIRDYRPGNLGTLLDIYNPNL